MSMQSEDTSLSFSADPEIPSRPVIHPPRSDFEFSDADTSILRGYMDRFEEADTQTRSIILEKVMGELYRL